MIDFDKQPLAVGDLVAFLPPNYRHMIKGRVIGFTPKMIRIEHVLEPKQLELYRERNYPIPTSLRDHGYVVKLPQNTL
jgi:hypothetical protein